MTAENNLTEHCEAAFKKQGELLRLHSAVSRKKLKVFISL